MIADAYPLQPLEAKVSFIAPAIDTSRGTIDIHLDVLEPAQFLRQGMTVSVDIRTGSRGQALVLSNDALHKRQGGRAEVLRWSTDRQVERVPVRLGLQGTALTEIVDGVSAGDIIISDEVAEGQRVRVRIEPMLASGRG